MSLPENNIRDREYDKFDDPGDGRPAVRIMVPDVDLGQRTMAQSVPVVIASDQISQDSTANSTTTPLGISGIFTGTFEDVSRFAFLSFQIFSDVASASSGLEFQWSPDGTNVDRTESTNLIAGIGRAFAIGVRGKYFRIKYTNGVIAQTSFRVKTVYHLIGTGLITKTLKASVNEDNFAQLVQAPIMARLADATFINIAGIKLDSTGILGVADPTAIMGNEGFAFKVSTNRISIGATSESPFLLIDNPSGSGKVLRIDKFIFVPTEIANTAITWKIYKSPTVTANGTLLAPTGNKNTGQVTATINFYTLPTISAKGTFNFFISLAQTSPPFEYNMESGTLLEPGFKMLVTADQTNNSAGGGINIEYSETVV